MLMDNHFKCATKRPLATEPFVDDHAERIEIAAPARLPLQLLRRGVEHGPLEIAEGRRRGIEALRDDGDAKVGEQHFTVWAEQHIVWLDVAVNQLVPVDIL